MTTIDPVGGLTPPAPAQPSRSGKEPGVGFAFLIFMMAATLDAKDKSTSGIQSDQQLLEADIAKKNAALNDLLQKIREQRANGSTDEDGMRNMATLLNSAQVAQAALDNATSQLSCFWQMDANPFSKTFFEDMSMGAHAVGMYAKTISSQAS